MGSRAVVIVCRDAGRRPRAVRRRRGRARASATRAPAGASSTTVISSASCSPRFGSALERGGFWERLETDWVCLDCELMPWSAKAQELVAPAVRGGRRRGARAASARAVSALRAGGRPRHRCRRRSLERHAIARRAGRALRAGVSALLLAGDSLRRHPPRAVPPAGDRRRGSRRQGPRLAHGHDGAASSQPMGDSADGDAVSRRGSGRSRRARPRPSPGGTS